MLAAVGLGGGALCWRHFAHAAILAKPPALIAHAGGIVNGNTYTNSLEALNENYKKGHRCFEIDLSFTSDDRLVLIHDWEGKYRRYFFGVDDGTIPSLGEFQRKKMKFGLTQLTADDLFQWMERHPDAVVVTDIKTDNIKGLRRIKEKFGKYTDRILPQVYNISEFFEAKSLGYPRIILTLYRTDASNAEILRLADQENVYAFTMFPRRGLHGALSRHLKDLHQTVYFHTINSEDQAQLATRFGAHGVYTDSLVPK